MILKKIFITLFLVSFLTGCIQNTAFLGPAVTVAGNGNIYQAGLSYVSNETITKITGKTPTGYIKSLLVDCVKRLLNFMKVLKTYDFYGLEKMNFSLACT